MSGEQLYEQPEPFTGWRRRLAIIAVWLWVHSGLARNEDGFWDEEVKP